MEANAKRVDYGLNASTCDNWYETNLLEGVEDALSNLARDSKTRQVFEVDDGTLEFQVDLRLDMLVGFSQAG